MRIYRILSENNRYPPQTFNQATVVGLRDMGVIKFSGSRTIRQGNTTVRVMEYRRAK